MGQEVSDARKKALLAMRGLVKQGGRILVSVWQKGEEDLETTKGFQCGWAREQWEQFLGEVWEVERVEAGDLLAWSLAER